MVLSVTSVIHVSTAVLAIISGTVIPYLAALLSKEKAAAWIVNTLQGVLVAVAGGVSVAASNGGNLAWQSLLGSVILTAGTVIVTTFFPGAQAAIRALRHKTPRFGLG